MKKYCNIRQIEKRKPRKKIVSHIELLKGCKLVLDFDQGNFINLEEKLAFPLYKKNSLQKYIRTREKKEQKKRKKKGTTTIHIGT